MTKLIILGASGMLGSMVLDYFSREGDIQLSATVRRKELIDELQPQFTNTAWRLLDAEACTVEDITATLADTAWAINAIGVIKPYIHDNNAAEVERAVRVNSLFPHLLAHAAKQTGCRVIQIATDCVYSGRQGNYTEKDEVDPLDVYGKTKSLGEVSAPNMYHLRCSIIGPEPKGHVSLLDWFLSQPHNAGVKGYTNHHWNGITTLHFARLCRGIIKRNMELPNLQHVIPTGTVTKAKLLQCFAREYRRSDINITLTSTDTTIDRTLATTNEELNRKLWEAAGHATSPSVPEMVYELAAFSGNLSHEVRQ